PRRGARRMNGPGRRPSRLAIARRRRTHLWLAPQGDGSWLSPAASRESLGITVDRALELGRGRVRKIASLADVFQNVGVLAAQERQQPLLERAHPVDRQRIEIAVDARIDDDGLL